MNIQDLQNQIYELQKIVCGVLGDTTKLSEILKAKPTSSSCSLRFNPMSTPKDFNMTPTSSSASNLVNNGHI